jgi:hypothetical protein
MKRRHAEAQGDEDRHREGRYNSPRFAFTIGETAAGEDRAMPRFVVLRHDHLALHWDLMLEAGAVLRTWRLAAPLSLQGGTVASTVSFDHRLAYLDYEGPISGGRGAVVREEHGTFTVLQEEQGELTVRMEGQHLRGILVVTATADTPGQAVFTPDASAAQSPPVGGADRTAGREGTSAASLKCP